MVVRSIHISNTVKFLQTFKCNLSKERLIRSEKTKIKNANFFFNLMMMLDIKKETVSHNSAYVNAKEMQ